MQVGASWTASWVGPSQVIDKGRKTFKSKAENSLKPNFLRPKMAV